MWFKQGAAYRFIRDAKKELGGYGGRVRRLAFVRNAPGAGVTHHLFRSMVSGYLESFTEAQLCDYRIEKVA